MTVSICSIVALVWKDFFFSLTKVFASLGHGVLYFKLFSLLLQEMTFEIDEDFLYAMLDFAQFNSGVKKIDEEYV